MVLALIYVLYLSLHFPSVNENLGKDASTVSPNRQCTAIEVPRDFVLSFKLSY